MVVMIALQPIASQLFGEGDASQFVLPQTTSGWVGLCLSHVSYAFAMISYFLAIAWIGAGKVTLFSNLEPLVVTGLSFLLLSQVLAPLQLVGVGIVIIALFIVARSKSESPTETGG